MICPKCGLDQEERLDCKECGIVFSKYNALFSSSESSDSANEGTLKKSEFQELQLQVRELGSRLIEAEFEKVERKQLRSDLKNLEGQIRQNRSQAEARIQQIEERLESLGKESELRIAPEILENLPKPEEIEQKTAQLTNNLNSTIDQLTSLWEKTGQNSYQITDLRDQIIALRNVVLEMKDRMEGLQKNQVEEEPKTIYEDDVKAIRRNLDELGQFISELGKKP
jgi:chromosome segregation ATPase